MFALISNLLFLFYLVNNFRIQYIVRYVSKRLEIFNLCRVVDFVVTAYAYQDFRTKITELTVLDASENTVMVKL